MKKGSQIALNACIISSASVAGKKEFDGPLGNLFDMHSEDNRFGKKTWEAAESEMQRTALRLALEKVHRRDTELEALFAGDLLNQCVGSAYGLLDFRVPYFGLYGACSTSAESLLLSAMLVSFGCYSLTAAVTSSHFCSAERQFRFPLEYGSQRPPTAQWTVTASGAFLVGKRENNPHAVRIVGGLPGIAEDYGINDVGNMGAAMAPAAMDSLLRYFEGTGTGPEDYSAIVTGDLGFEGGSILCQLLKAKGVDLGGRYYDCGQLIFDRRGQDVHGGGSGCGCAAAVLSCYLLPKLKKREWKRMLFLATGAMMSPDSIKQGKNIPAIAHLLEFAAPKTEPEPV